MQVYSEPGSALELPDAFVPPPRATGEYSAGVGEMDITPPPGFPTGGDGPAGDVARGYWLRLRARAFFFEDPKGHTLAMVTADLFAVSAALRELVVRRLAQLQPDVSLPPSSLILAANHTHQGPGNFMSARLHNQFGSTFPGFDGSLQDFLAWRIAQALSLAIHDARSHHGDVTIKMHVKRVGYDLLLNRSPTTFGLNRDRESLLQALNRDRPPADCEPGEGEASGGWGLPGCPRLRGVDRSLSVLEIFRDSAGKSRRLGAMVFFAAHPTALDAATPFYSSDFSGYAMRVLEAKLAVAGQPVVVGFFNGAEGDVTLRRKSRDILAAREFGQKFAREVLQAVGEEPIHSTTNPEIAVRATTWFPSKGGEHASCDAIHLAAKPMVGAAMLGGAEGDRTQLHQLGWSEGVRDVAFDDQGVKLPALDTRIMRGLRITGDIITPDAFPDSIPLTYAKLGKVTFAAVPTEMTTAQGYAVRLEMAAALGLSSTVPMQGLPQPVQHGALEIIGLANEYDSYCSSRDEYTAQDYMGASTIWGPHEGPFLACKLGKLLAAKTTGSAIDLPARTFKPGPAPRKPFGTSFLLPIDRPDEGLDIVLLNRGKVPERSLPWFSWEEDSRCEDFECGVRRRVVMWQFVKGDWERAAAEYSAAFPGDLARGEDDQETGLLTMYLGSRRWAAIWLQPLFNEQLDGTFAFQVSAGGKGHVSKPFTIKPGARLPDRITEESIAELPKTRDRKKSGRSPE